MNAESMRRRAMQCMHPRVLGAAAVLAACVAVLPVACAQGTSAQDTTTSAQDDSLSPARVGRLADLAGDVYLAQQDHADDWSPVDENYPVTSGDNLWTSDNARAEVDFGGSQMRMWASTNVNVATLDSHALEIFVAQGSILLRVAALEAGDSAIVDTPSTQVVLVQPGLYRIDVSPDQQTTALTIREGEATAQVTAGLQQVLAGMSAIIVNAATTSAVFSVAYAPDAFDAWNASREGYYQQARGTTYVSPEMVGYDDLANYGTWQPDAAYGNVWYPNDVVPGWAPYSDGYWTTIPLFGLTWVDHARWGYAPFHYGRWARVHNRWGWLPGNYVARPVWAPALVAWTSVGVSGGGAVHGWVPLGFREPYRPWWGACGARCWDRYNRPYQIDPRERDRYRDHAPPPERFANWRVPGAVTAVAAARLIARKPYVASERIALAGSALASARPVNAAPAVTGAAPGRIPVVHPGAHGAPQPASVFYMTSKPAQMGIAHPLNARPAVGRPVGGLSLLDATGARAPAARAPRDRIGPAAGNAPSVHAPGNPVLPSQPPGSAAPRIVVPGNAAPRIVVPGDATPVPNAGAGGLRLHAPPRGVIEGTQPAYGSRSRVVNDTAHAPRAYPGAQGSSVIEAPRMPAAQRVMPPPMQATPQVIRAPQRPVYQAPQREVIRGEPPVALKPVPNNGAPSAPNPGAAHPPPVSYTHLRAH